jgi:hypothetical protein
MIGTSKMLLNESAYMNAEWGEPVGTRETVGIVD